ncbi:hypothetical protein [Streptomyces geranii]|uniref:hypothetical protein n=1 Tax=Streptomyces geranii TaxID=2058923 RepID=UPI000D02595C|nr:hypothetical protein [Streptomyces geranii]
MPPERDTYDAHDAYDGPGGLDALLAAITDEPLPAHARADADFMAEHRSAKADVALLREQLTLLGETLAPEHTVEHPADHPADHPAAQAAARATTEVRRLVPLRERTAVRRLRAVGLGVAAVAAAGALISGAGWLVTHASVGTDDASSSTAADRHSGEAGAKDGDASDYPSLSTTDGGVGVDAGGTPGALSSPAYLACVRLIVEGDVTAVEPGPDAGQERVTLRVTRYYKPDTGPAEVTFVMDREADPRPAVGDHALVGILTDATSPDIWTTDEREIAVQRARITAELPRSRTLSCE